MKDRASLGMKPNVYEYVEHPEEKFRKSSLCGFACFSRVIVSRTLCCKNGSILRAARPQKKGIIKYGGAAARLTRSLRSKHFLLKSPDY